MLSRGGSRRVPRQPPRSCRGTPALPSDARPWGPEEGHPSQRAGLGHLCPAWHVAFSEARAPDACCPLSADRAELAEKWKAEREARLARGEEAEGEEEEAADIYAVAEEEVGRPAARGSGRAPGPGQAPGPVCPWTGGEGRIGVTVRTLRAPGDLRSMSG